MGFIRVRGRQPGRGAAAGLALAAVLLAGCGGGPERAPGRAPAEAAAPTGPAAAEDSCDTAASLRPSAADGPAVRRIRERGRLIALVDQSSYLWGYRNPATGDIEGFDIDLVRAVAADILGDPDKVTYLTTDTDRRFEAIRAGEVDLMARTTSITCERMADAAFSTVYFETGQQLLVPKTSPIEEFDGRLRGRRVCVGRGTTAYDLLEREIDGVRIVTVDNGLDCLVRLQLGEVDAVFTHSSLAAGQAAQDPNVHLVGSPVGVNRYGIAMNTADTDLVRRVNRVLEEYRADGSWQRSYDRWLADLLPDDHEGPPPARYRD